MSVAESKQFPAWAPLESNPEAFTKLARDLGLSGDYEFTEVLGLDPDLLAMLPGPVEAAIFLFPTQNEKIENFRKENLKNGEPKGVYYAHQYVGNACGTYALCHTLFNRLDLLKADSPLAKFMKDTEKMDPHERGLKLADSSNPEEHPVFKVHTKVATDGNLNQTATLNENAKVEEHFTAYVDVSGIGATGNSSYVLELDGRLRKIVQHDAAGGSFIEKVAGIVKSQFFDLDPTENNFSLIALCKKG